jgi:hypothetical protein
MPTNDPFDPPPSPGSTTNPPIVTSPIADRSTAEDAVFSFTLPANTFIDLDVNDILTYTARLSNGATLPSWLSFNASTRVFAGTPGNGDVGVNEIRVIATDSGTASVYDDFVLTVTNVNDAPTLASPIPDRNADADSSTFSYTIPAGTFTDIDTGDSLSYTATRPDGSALPSGLVFNAATRTVSGIPLTAGPLVPVKITATDSAGAQTSDEFTINFGTRVPVSAKYFITDARGSHIDWSYAFGGFSLAGKGVHLTGGAGDDTLYVQAGGSANATNLDIGNDRIYLTGNLADYTQSINQETLVFTLSRSVNAQTEVVKFTVSDQNDVVYFANGHITINGATNTQIYSTGTLNPIQAGWLTAGGTPASPVSSAATLANTPTKIFIVDAQGLDVPMLPQPGQAMIVTGSGGADSVYVNAGTSVDATNLDIGNDRIYLTGNLADYTQSINQETLVFTLNRSVEGKPETVKFTVADQNDVVYFANGHIVINGATNAQLYSNGTLNPIQAGWLAAGGTPTPGLRITNTATLDNLANLDVRSELVLNFSDTLQLGSGQIKILEDTTTGWTVSNTTSAESKQDVTDNDVVITLLNGAVTGLTIGGVDKSAEMAGSVTTNGTKLIISPAGSDSASATDWDFDWDFGANYHVELDAGVVTANGVGNLALTDATTLNFTTVTPLGNATGAVSQKMAADGTLTAGYTWHHGHVDDATGSGAAMNFATGSHGLMLQANGGDSRSTTIGGKVLLSGFGTDDVIYMDNLGEMSLATTEGTTGASYSGTGNTQMRALANSDGGTQLQTVFADYASTGYAAVTTLGGGDILLENSLHFNANLVIFG